MLAVGEEIDVEEVSNSERIPLLRNVFEAADNNLHDFLASAHGGLLTDDQSAFKKAMMQRYLTDSVEVMYSKQGANISNKTEAENGSRKRRRSSGEEPEAKRKKSEPKVVARPVPISESVNARSVPRGMFPGFGLGRNIFDSPVPRPIYPFLNSIPLPMTLPFLPRPPFPNPFYHVINNESL